MALSKKRARWTLNRSSSPQEIDNWFQHISPSEQLINELADTIVEWGKADLKKLKLLERDLSDEDIVKLLKSKSELLECNGDLVIHTMVLFDQSATIRSLLDRVKSQDDFLSIVSLKDGFGLNVFGYACWWNRLDLYRYLAERVGKNETYDLLCEQNKFGWTGLHWAIDYDNAVDEFLSLLGNISHADQLLCIKDREGRTAFSCSIYWAKEKSFHSIIKFYMDRQEDRLLLDMASITDKEGNTSFHHAAGQETCDVFIALIRSTCSPDTRHKLGEVLTLRNIRGSRQVRKRSRGELKDCHLDYEVIYNWVLNSITHNRYLLFDYPSVLVLYDVSTREIEAETEAQSLIKCFKDLGFEVQLRNSFTKRELFEAIEHSQHTAASKNGQIVALMSHGFEGYIKDSNGIPIPLKEIEEKMCADTHSNTPKLLILQCCQGIDKLQAQRCQATGKPQHQHKDIEQVPALESASLPTETDQPDADPTNPKNPVTYVHESYAPRNREFCALLSTGPGSDSVRNQFIPELAQAINNMKTETTISEVMKAINKLFIAKKLIQVPFCCSSLSFGLCIKTILPIYMTIMREEARKGKTTQQTSAESIVTLSD